MAALDVAGRRARSDDPTDAELIMLHERAVEPLLARIDEMVAAEPDFATFQQLEVALVTADGIPLRDAKRRLKALAKDEAIRRELAARDAYRRCAALLGSNRSDERAVAAEGFAELAQRMPETIYGRKAAAR